MAKDLFNQIMDVYPDINHDEFYFGSIRLQNDSDGTGDYIAKWEYEKPLPNHLKQYLRIKEI